MNIAKEFWRYWKWLCVALMTSFVVLALLAAIITYVKPSAIPREQIDACLDGGGAWDADTQSCKAPA